jgi:hypothetical protein
MVYRGDITANTMAEIKLLADFSNTGSAVIVAGVGAFGGDAKVQSAVVAPGGSGTLTLKTPTEGILKIFVDFPMDDDSGRVEVKAGAFSDGDSISGDTIWTYSV